MSQGSTLDLARSLIARASVTPEDGGCMEILCARLAACGFAIERMDRGPVANLWARRGRERPIVCLAGHTDVVPPGPAAQWSSDPFVPAQRDGLLFGRGAADMKSSLAAFVCAAERFVADRPAHRGSVAFLLTSDEEGDAVDGTARVVEALRERDKAPDYCIVGEPTSAERLGDTIKNGRRGSLNGRLIVRGIQGHVAYPEAARNPIHEAMPALSEIARTRWDEGEGGFPPTSFQISNLHAGTGATNMIPGTLEALFNFRFSTASPETSLRERVAAVLDRHGLDYALSWNLSGQPYLTRSGALIAALAGSILGRTGIEPALSTGGGTSDGRFIATICPEVAEFGPVNASIHKVDEHIRVEDLEALSDIYRGVLERLLAG
ncbi:MAG: succinyl-diaminopimelate desuccinylase [Rhodocyclales bacterium CG_4_10_14_3_um_filter_68_10]|nr:MAG: succinyl-diaminopimelate desuccinylase [Rhodocyclales bacterium CG_4_10_14_3_um_filter_68_10]